MKKFINNGVEATAEDLKALEENAKNGEVRVTAKIVNDEIHYSTD